LGGCLPLPLHHRHARACFKALPAAKTRPTKDGTEGGMNTKFTLTGQEKIMNMAKLGIVSGAGIDLNRLKFLSKINKMRKSLYTLCVFRSYCKRSKACRIATLRVIAGRIKISY
jgi:hypothetical protein